MVWSVNDIVNVYCVLQTQRRIVKSRQKQRLYYTVHGINIKKKRVSLTEKTTFHKCSYCKQQNMKRWKKNQIKIELKIILRGFMKPMVHWKPMFKYNINRYIFYFYLVTWTFNMNY